MNSWNTRVDILSPSCRKKWILWQVSCDGKGDGKHFLSKTFFFTSVINTLMFPRFLSGIQFPSPCCAPQNWTMYLSHGARCSIVDGKLRRFLGNFAAFLDSLQEL